MRMKGERLRKRLQFRVDNRQEISEQEQKDLEENNKPSKDSKEIH